MNSTHTIIAGTGHRPNKLGGYGPEVNDKLIRLAYNALSRIKPHGIISGMALGWDQALAEAAIQLGIPFVAAIPFRGQSSVWPVESQLRYDQLLSKAYKTVVVSTGAYSTEKMQIRNKWMVDACTDVLALWDGSAGGTGNCIRYANEQHKIIINLWDEYKQLN